MTTIRSLAALVAVVVVVVVVASVAVVDAAPVPLSRLRLLALAQRQVEFWEQGSTSALKGLMQNGEAETRLSYANDPPLQTQFGQLVDGFASLLSGYHMTARALAVAHSEVVYEFDALHSFAKLGSNALTRGFAVARFDADAECTHYRMQTEYSADWSRALAALGASTSAPPAYGHAAGAAHLDKLVARWNAPWLDDDVAFDRLDAAYAHAELRFLDAGWPQVDGFAADDELLIAQRRRFSRFSLLTHMRFVVGRRVAFTFAAAVASRRAPQCSALLDGFAIVEFGPVGEVLQHERWTNANDAFVRCIDDAVAEKQQ